MAIPQQQWVVPAARRQRNAHQFTLASGRRRIRVKEWTQLSPVHCARRNASARSVAFGSRQRSFSAEDRSTAGGRQRQLVLACDGLPGAARWSFRRDRPVTSTVAPNGVWLPAVASGEARLGSAMPR